MKYFREKTALIKDSKIGDGSKIWNYVNIYGSIIGKYCTIGSYTEIQNDVIIGNNVTISSHSFICSMVVVEDDVFIGHGVMTINDSNPPSFRKTGTKDQWKPIIIKKGAIIGSNATIFPVVIGENARVGAGAVVTRDVPANATVIGNPAKIIN